MSNIITVGFITEGTTDVRYLNDVIRQTVEAVAVECTTTIEVHSVESIDVPKTDKKVTSTRLLEERLTKE